MGRRLVLHQPELSSTIKQVLGDNHFQLERVLRYGPRFVSLKVHSGDRDALFKMVLPEEEQDTTMSTAALSRRVVKEAVFLQFFAQQFAAGGHLFEPQVFAYSEDVPAWSLRSYINSRPMSAWDSAFVLRPGFYEEVDPVQMVEFFHRLQKLSTALPEKLRGMIAHYRSTLLDSSRIDHGLWVAGQDAELRSLVPRITQFWRQMSDAFEDYEPVITHYEPYAPHIFVSEGQVGLIDWENVGWGHKLQDLSVLYMRVFDHPAWQASYVAEVERLGYFRGNGRTYWLAEVMIQALANLFWFKEGPIGSPEYDRRASRFFKQQIAAVLEECGL